MADTIVGPISTCGVETADKSQLGCCQPPADTIGFNSPRSGSLYITHDGILLSAAAAEAALG